MGTDSCPQWTLEELHILCISSQRICGATAVPVLVFASTEGFATYMQMGLHAVVQKPNMDESPLSFLTHNIPAICHIPSGAMGM